MPIAVPAGPIGLHAEVDHEWRRFAFRAARLADRQWLDGVFDAGLRYFVYREDKAR